MVDFIKTRTQLIHRALAAIGALEPGEAPSTEDYNTMDNLVDPLIAQLAADDIVSIGESEEIPVEYFIPLANLLGNMAGPDFGSPVNDDAKARDEATLKRIISTRPTYAIAKGAEADSSYF
jgi:hypothetical protein